MHEHKHGQPFRFGRRDWLTGAGAAAVAGSIGALGFPSRAAADGDDHDDDGDALRRAKPAPAPIPGGVESGLPADHPLAFIHWFLPGPTDLVTPFVGLPGFGLDVEPSLLTDFSGFTAFAVLSGQAKGSDGKTYNVEFDVRVMEGRYRAADGTNQRGAFGFF